MKNFKGYCILLCEGSNMSEFSIEKLKNKKKEKCLTNRKISEKTGIPLVTVDKLFSGVNKNPTVKILQKITTILECTMDDLIDYSDSPLENYYNQKEINKLAQEIQDNDKLRILISATRDLDESSINLIVDIANKIKNSNS